MSFFTYRILVPYFYKIKKLRPLNMIDYNPNEALKILKKEIDLHLSPSDCITNIARDSYKIAENKCKSFPHFIQKFF